MNNLLKRSLTGIIFVVILSGAICINEYTFLLLFGLITALSLWELLGLIKKPEDNATVKRLIHCAAGLYLFAGTFVYNHGIAGSSIFLPYLLYVFYALISELYFKASNPLQNWGQNLFVQVYCAGAFSCMNLISLDHSDGTGKYTPLFVMAIFIFVWLNDTGAFLVGSTIGKHRLFERISPKKSWEGFFGGLVVALIASQVIAHYYPEISWYNWLGLSAVIVLFGTWGDLTESLLKRTLGKKDSGSLLPGHGGMLDRFDSVIMAAPAAYVYIELFIRN